ncbi:MAG: hypothetical protein IKX88_03725 [Thermoguttaceae bacterium]|nr:hypothetical protein [Thermoguttaceae bacterium]
MTSLTFSDRRSFALSTLALLLFATLFACSGCATIMGQLRLNAADVRFSVGKPGGPKYSQGTTQTLKAYDVPQRNSMEQLDALLEKLDANPTPELVYAYVETAYLQARSHELRSPDVAKRLYVSAALYAYHYLFNPALNAQRDSVFNAQFRDVVVLYNGACERLFHLTLPKDDEEEFPFQPDKICRLALDTSNYLIYTHIASCAWDEDELESFKLVADCPVESLSFDCRRSGFGVPLVAKRRPVPDLERPEEEYYPGDLQFPVTAILRPNLAIPLGSLPPIDPDASYYSAGEEEAQATLEIYDPFSDAVLSAYGRELLLETDITTPLAYFLNQKSRLNASSAQKGLLRPEEFLEITPTESPTVERTLQGLYMLEPYDPKKIPVVMTHGLGSSPSTWLEAYNALRNSLDIQNAYQFWFYFYPTGQPFWASAAQLRLELARLRETVGPDHEEPALDQIVLVGHSMGGLISRMQVQTSGDKIWNKISHTPLDELDFDEETRQDLRSWFFFEANPSVTRVVTIATPFEGSDYANNFTQWLAERAISIPQTVTRVIASATDSTIAQLDDPTLLETNTSVDSLSPKCPIFAALDECEIPENVALNNIVGVLPKLANRTFMSKKSDGIVEFWSSHRDDAESEKEVAASHVDVHAHPAAILELKRILTLHLKLARSAPNVPTSSADDRPTLDNPYTDDYDRDRVFHQDPNKRRYGD